MACAKTMQIMYNDFSNVFARIKCFKGTFSVQANDCEQPYQGLTRHESYTLQEPFRKELDRLQDQLILAPLGVNKTVEWHKSFVIVPQPNGTICLYLDPTRLYQALTKPAHYCPTNNGILPKLINACYMILMDLSSGYHNLKLDKKSFYLTTFVCQF